MKVWDGRWLASFWQKVRVRFSKRSETNNEGDAMNKGYVYLVGAGPGDIGLITVKGLECIQRADVIVYDRLANPRLLSYARPDAKYIYVGKTPDHHTLKQEEINEVLVEEALKGQVVTRLKGGDPYVFGRGGEEGERLREAGVPFEVVPGITSAIAVPSYAGIPVTHRHLTSTFTVITGHEDPLKASSQINWQRLAEDPGTLIFLMGVGHLAQIVAQLVDHGKSAATPIALIRWGTRPEQQVVVGTLATIVEDVARAGLTSPAIIIVGEVVTMRDTLSWFEQKPLFGQRILVTRAREQASVFSRMIEEAGGEAWEAPTIAIDSAAETPELRDAVAKAGNYDWIIFTSVNGVQAFFDAMRDSGRDIRSLGKAKVCAIGPKTKEALEAKGLIVAAMPEKFVAESVLECLKPLLNFGEKILLPRSDLARTLLVDTLRDLGMKVDEVVAYRTKKVDRFNDEILEKLRDKSIHIVTFTSSSTVKNFMELVGDKEILEGIRLASIGPVTTKTLAEFGLTPDIEATDYTIKGLFNAIVETVNKEDA
ncbi:MAG: uroporphyrinogen-III C-methyltransferase [Peptococcaceae bacterium]|nr:uroporphyrinogen-III C-methyltransferase [Peptococcaceae bacterium]